MTEVWLIGQMSQHLIETKLPSKKEVMSLFFYHKNIIKMNIRDSARFTAVAVMTIWDKARIPTRLQKHIINKVEIIFNEWQKLKKNKENKTKRSEGLKEKENNWQKTLDELFDIAHADALNIIGIEEDKQFLLLQRKEGRPGKIGNIDRKLAKKEVEIKKKNDNIKKRRMKEDEKIKSLTGQSYMFLSSCSEDDSDLSDENTPTVDESSIYKSPPKKRGRKNLLDRNLAVSLDVAKLSDRKAAVVLTNTIKRLGNDPLEYNVNTSSIRRQRIQYRQEIAESVKNVFTPEVPLTIHWDGKIIEDIIGHETVDRLPILVSGKSVDQLLAIPKLISGTGQSISLAVYETTSSWGLCDKIKCMSFDTTAVNTGLRNGACILLEQNMDKDMLWLACRHHIMEIMLEAVVVHAIGCSSGPDILLFKRFKKSWSTIQSEHFETVISDASTSNKIENISTDMIIFASKQLEEFQPRDDYKELLNLCIIFLGGVPKKGLSFRSPGGLHRARWMAKAIYSLKIYLFRGQFKLTKKEYVGICDICIFTVRIYIKYWFQAATAIYSPRNDLQLLKDLKKYEEVNVMISKKAMKKFLGHLWYLSEELIAFAFFD